MNNTEIKYKEILYNIKDILEGTEDLNINHYNDVDVINVINTNLLIYDIVKDIEDVEVSNAMDILKKHGYYVEQDIDIRSVYNSKSGVILDKEKANDILVAAFNSKEVKDLVMSKIENIIKFKKKSNG